MEGRSIRMIGPSTEQLLHTIFIRIKILKSPTNNNNWSVVDGFWLSNGHIFYFPAINPGGTCRFFKTVPMVKIKKTKNLNLILLLPSPFGSWNSYPFLLILALLLFCKKINIEFLRHAASILRCNYQTSLSLSFHNIQRTLAQATDSITTYLNLARKGFQNINSPKVSGTFF